MDFQVVKVSLGPRGQRARKATQAYQAMALKESQGPLDSVDPLALQDFRALVVRSHKTDYQKLFSSSQVVKKAVIKIDVASLRDENWKT